jgi:hypothetical protein
MICGFVFRDGRLAMRIEGRGRERLIEMPYEIREGEWDAAAGWLVLTGVGSTRRRKLACYARAMARDLRLARSIINDSLGLRTNGCDYVANTYRSAVDSRRTLGTYAALLADELARHGCRRTARGYLSTARRFIELNHGYDICLDELSAGTIETLQTALAAEGIAPNTLSFYMRTLRAIYNKAVAENIVPQRLDNPFENAYVEVSV